MAGNNPKLYYFFIVRIHVWGICLSASRKWGLFISSLLFFSSTALCQCPENTFFKKQINTVYTSTKKKESQLNELLQLRLQMKACHLETDSSFMYLLQKIGVIYYTLADYKAAINFTNESIVLAKECIRNQSCNTLALVHNYDNLTYYYEKNGQPENKYAAIDSCILYALKGNQGFEMALPGLIDKTEYLFNKGEYDLCSKDAKLGEDITKKYYHENDSILYMVSFVSKQAHYLYFSKKFSAAEKLLENKIPQFEETGNGNQLYAFYRLLGLINMDTKNYEKALSYFQKAYHANSILTFRKGCVHNLVSIGKLYAKNFNSCDTGLKYCARALKYADDATDSLLIFRQTGSIYVLKGLYDKAQYYYQQAFNTVQHGMNETTLLHNSFQFPSFNQLQNLSDLATDKGDAYVQQYYHTKDDRYLKEAISVYKKTDLFLAKIKTEQQLQLSSNLVWRTTARNLYEHAIEACYANNNIEDAFYFFEKSRAVLLNDQINEQRWIADEDNAKQAGLKKRIAGLETLMKKLPASSEEYFSAQKKLYTNFHELAGLIRNIKNKNPLVYQNYLDTVFITVQELRKRILINSKTLVEIFSGESAAYVLTIAPTKQSFNKLNKYSYDSLSNLYNSFITNQAKLNKNFRAFTQTAKQLYSLLFPNNAPPDGSVIISPDGVSYPFEALIIKEQDPQPDYFLNHYAISYTYSVKYLTNQFTSNTSSSNTVLGIAPVQYKKRLNLAALYGSSHSLNNINKYFNTTNYVLEKATKNNFLQNFPRYNIIHLYTHAADSSINNDPVIYFADSALYLSDLIPGRKPVTQLVLLSACETATGKLYEGEGVFSFNRGFAALGIPAAISNLWSVDNESTYRITELFYKYLSQGLPTDVALQKAKLEFINNSSSKEKKLPYFWAGSILTGKVDIIKGKPGFAWRGLVAGGIFLLGIAYFTIKIMQRNKKRANAIS